MATTTKGSVKILDLDGKETENFDLPQIFTVPVREDVIGRAYVALDSHRRQPQGRDPLAGERTTAETSNPPTGRGISRIPRVKGERYSKSGMAGGVASIVHGRLPFPPRSEKVIRKEINRKERRLALASAIAATADKELVADHGHLFSADLPIVVSDDIEKVAKVRDLKKFLAAIGADKELGRTSRRKKKLNSKIARTRRTGSGPLFVVSDSSTLKPALKSLPGVSVVRSSDLSVLDLAPGSSPGRLTIWTKSSLGALPKPLIELSERYYAS
jgi:large subunit ribosomal protein L4e